MKKLENFSNCLNVLKNADFDLADNNDIYRTGVIGQFNLTFELAWKALQEILKMAWSRWSSNRFAKRNLTIRI